MSSNFYVGQRVVCVDERGHFPESGSCPPPLVSGKVYTITGIPNNCVCSTVTVGISNTYFGTCPLERCARCGNTRKPPAEWGFLASRFRPLLEQSVSAQLVKELQIREVEERPEHLTVECVGRSGRDDRRARRCNLLEDSQDFRSDR